MVKDKDFNSALSVSEGVSQPSSTNSNAIKRLKELKKKKQSAEEIAQGVLNGDRTCLSKAITLVESNLQKHQTDAQSILQECLPHSGDSIRIGITGVPGVGKSTFIEAFGKYLTSIGHKIAVLAIDPSSQRTGGSILGDKTRMEYLASDKNAFIRPSPSAGSLGGVARKTRESIILCEAAGFDVIIIETVGVGQSETAVHSMVDFFLLLMLAGAGDELQGIKRGIMEMADLIAITKADGNNVHKAGLAKIEYQNALYLFPKTESGWKPSVVTCSSVNRTGIDNIWSSLSEYRTLTLDNGFFEHRRNNQNKYWMHESIEEQLKSHFYNNEEVAPLLEKLSNDVCDNKISSFVAANTLIERYLKGK